MKETLLPQNTRLAAVLLGFIGGALDVFCHMQYDVLVATQTGNIILLIADVQQHDLASTILRVLSILSFSAGFLFGVFVKDHRKTAYWRSYTLLPLVGCSLILPFLPNIPYLNVCLIAFATGMMMLTFTGSLIEKHPFTILMTSGNYRKMLMALYRVLQGKGDQEEFKRQAINYGLIVGSFLTGAISSAILTIGYHDFAIWLISFALIVFLTFYSYSVRKDHLQYSNL
ncbi:YoaK family protein [Streptococcus sp. DD13]|uniref:YoaK family protein n=1 Tax=Streptococcus sp. DD13 TaxID=1777881 RepID=UPI000799907A|nr:YoaK family protein [Streptococcus sp. DD13]KXT77814.1 putative membrane protein [Streptococcus sp. DD13]